MKFFVAAGAIFAGIGVVSGAFGAHALESTLSEENLSAFRVGVRYQMIHALAIVIVGLLKSQQPGLLLDVSGWCFIGGILLFTGSIYLLTLTGMKWPGPVTPIGGILFIAGWFLLAGHVLFTS